MMRKRNGGARFPALLLLLMLLVSAICPAMAENTGEVPAEAVSPYRIVLTAPGGWSSNNGAVMKVSVTDRDSLGWYKIEYRMNGGSWIDCEDLFDNGKAEITVHENGTFTLRMTDPHGHTFEESASVHCIDLASPTVSAAISGDMLEIQAEDDLSGIAGIQVNSMLFTTVAEGKLSVELDANMNKFEKLAVRAFDFAGNFSEPISLDNPHYEKPADPTPEPTATPTPKPTKKPAGAAQPSDSPSESPVIISPTPELLTATEKPHQGLGGSLIYIYDDDVYEPTPAPTAVPTTKPTAAPTPEPIIQTEYITIGPGMPYQADGNSHTLDVLYSAATNKQFITLQSKSGNTFYLVIDYDKPIDEEAEMYETYFLNLVDERDLLALMSDEEKEEVPTPTPQVIYVTPEPTAVPLPTAVPTEPPAEPEQKPDQMTAIIALVGIIALVIIGVFVLKKNKGTGGKMRADSELDLEEDDEENESNPE